MLNPFQTIRTALPYLSNKEVKTAFDKFLRQLERDGDEVGFEPSTVTERAAKDIEQAINELDEASGTKKEILKEIAREIHENEDEDS